MYEGNKCVWFDYFCSRWSIVSFHGLQNQFMFAEDANVCFERFFLLCNVTNGDSLLMLLSWRLRDGKSRSRNSSLVEVEKQMPCQESPAVKSSLPSRPTNDPIAQNPFLFIRWWSHENCKWLESSSSKKNSTMLRVHKTKCIFFRQKSKFVESRAWEVNNMKQTFIARSKRKSSFVRCQYVYVTFSKLVYCLRSRFVVGAKNTLHILDDLEMKRAREKGKKGSISLTLPKPCMNFSRRFFSTWNVAGLL